MWFKKRKNKQPAAEKQDRDTIVILKIANVIRTAQTGWANWMTRQAAKISIGAQKRILVTYMAAGSIALSYPLFPLFRQKQIPVPLKHSMILPDTAEQVIPGISRMPSDSLRSRSAKKPRLP